MTSKKIVAICLLVALTGIAGCAGNGGNGGGNATTGETTAAETTTGTTTGATTGMNGTTATTAAGTTTSANGTTNATGGQQLFNATVNVSANGTVYGSDGGFLGNVSIVDDNQQGGDGFFDVNIYSNGTVVDQQGEVVGQVEVNEVCPTAGQNGEFYFNGDSVDVSGANGDVFFDNQDDSFVDLNIVEDNQGQQSGFQNVRIATNGSVINQQGEVVGQVQVNQNCSAATSQS